MTGEELEIIERLAQLPLIQLMVVGGLVVIVASLISAVNTSRSFSRVNDRVLDFVASTKLSIDGANKAMDAMREAIERRDVMEDRRREQEITQSQRLVHTLHTLNTTVSGVPGQVQAGLDTHQNRLVIEMTAHKQRMEDIDQHVTQMIDLVSRLNDSVNGLSTAADDQHGEMLTALSEIHGDIRKLKALSEEIERETTQHENYGAGSAAAVVEHTVVVGGAGAADADAGDNPNRRAGNGANRGTAVGGTDKDEQSVD